MIYCASAKGSKFRLYYIKIGGCWLQLLVLFWLDLDDGERATLIRKCYHYAGATKKPKHSAFHKYISKYEQICNYAHKANTLTNTYCSTCKMVILTITYKVQFK